MASPLPPRNKQYGGTCVFGFRWSLLSDYYSTGENISYFPDEYSK